MNLNDIMSTLRKVYDKYSGIRLGIAGSFANGTQKPGSDIDVVIDGDSMRVDIMEYIKSQFQYEVDVLWVELMKQEDEEMDKFALENDLPINKFSVYACFFFLFNRKILFICQKPSAHLRILRLLLHFLTIQCSL